MAPTPPTPPTPPLSDIPDGEVIATLIGAHGQIDLAAARLNTAEHTLIARLTHVPRDLLAAAIQNIQQIQMFEMFASFKLTVLATIGDLNPTQRATFLERLIPQLATITAAPPPPPVHREPSSSALSVNFNLAQAMRDEADGARDSLIARLDSLPSPDRAQTSDHSFVSTTATDPAVRLGPDGAPITEGT